MTFKETDHEGSWDAENPKKRSAKPGHGLCHKPRALSLSTEPGLMKGQQEVGQPNYWKEGRFFTFLATSIHSPDAPPTRTSRRMGRKSWKEMVWQVSQLKVREDFVRWLLAPCIAPMKQINAGRLMHWKMWKDTTLFTTEEWLVKTMELVEMAKLIYLIREKEIYLNLLLTGKPS